MSRYVIMGVSGCGKSTIGAALAERCGLEFIDGDALHPKANIDKMARGEPLDDDDRAPWLAAVGDALGEDTIIACSALKRSYRDTIRDHCGGRVTFLFLDGNRETLEQRMKTRDRHFMPTSLLDSQLATLEVPGDDERVIRADIDRPPEEIVETFAAGMEGPVPARR